MSSDLKTRVVSAAIFGAGVLSILYAGGAAYAVLMGLALAVGVYEWVRMIRHERKPLLRHAFWAFGVVYIAASVGAMLWLRLGTEYGLYNMLTLLCIVWGSDVSAYFTGRAIGGPKLAPAISPKKTWAGFIGSSVGAGLLAAGLACPEVLDRFDVDTIGSLQPLSYGALGFVLAMAGQGGDLFISVFKRRYGIKDTGAIMPGHGGILDRIDALLLVSLIFAFIAKVLS